MTEEQYRVELSRMRIQIAAAAATDAATLCVQLPSWFEVDSGGKQYHVTFDALRSRLQAATHAEDWATAKQAALDELDLRIAELGGAPGNFQAAHAELNAILSQREFNRVHGQTWWDRTWGRMVDAINRAFASAFGNLAGWTGTRYLIYGLAVVILLVFGIWIWRTLPKSPAVALNLQATAISARPWSEWLELARIAAASGEWREGIHLAYWAGISALEGRGMWKPDRARTPREYLRLLPAQANERASLSAMTREFERAWYAQLPAGPDEYERMLRSLEGIGCQ